MFCVTLIAMLEPLETSTPETGGVAAEPDVARPQLVSQEPRANLNCTAPLVVNVPVHSHRAF
jgi:hypothetical protein